MSYSYKIYKMATQKSIMDVLDALDYHKENKNNELVYKGKIAFLINEYGGNKMKDTAYLDKSAAKLLSYSILNHHFPKLYESKPFQEFGGTKGSVIRSRIFSVYYNPKMNNPYRFQIDEGPGYVGNNGQITMAKSPDGKLQIEKTVHILATYEQAVKMSHEIYNFIQHAELIALSSGKPYVTLMPKREDLHDSTTDEYIEPSENTEVMTNEHNQHQADDYVIKIGTLAGRKITELEPKMLEVIIAKMAPDSEEKIELIEAAKAELRKR